MKVSIVTDSTSDLPSSVAEELEIAVVPVSVQFGDRVYKDGIDISTDTFYEMLKTNPVLPKTSAPSIGTFEEVYREVSQKCDAIVSIHIASKLSATYDSARLACSNINFPISVIDSETASMACGLLAITAAKAAIDGANTVEIERHLRDRIPRTITYGVFSTLDYLLKGGRIGRAQAFVGSLLKISPILAIRNGDVLPVARIRTRSKAIDRLCDIVRELGEIEALSVMRTTTPEDAEDLVNRLSPLFPAEKIYRTSIGPAIATYIGPDAVGISVMWK